MKGAHALGDLIAAGPGDVRDFVEIEVEIAEVRAHDVPMRLLGREAQGDEVDENRLEVLGQGVGGDEAVFGVLASGLR